MRDAILTVVSAMAMSMLVLSLCYLLLPDDHKAVYFPIVPFYVPITPN